jgi:hypothetical protein
LAAVAEMVREDRDEVARIVDDLERIGLVLWDANAGVVYVPCVCAEQFRWTGSAKKDPSKDFRLIEGRRHIASLPPSPLVELFLSRWPTFKPEEAPYQAPTRGATEGAYQGSTTYTGTAPSSEWGPDVRESDR